MQPHNTTVTEYVCETCGKVHSRDTAQTRRYRHHFCCVACRQAWHRGPAHASWISGRLQHPSGYIRITLPNGGGTVWEHRWVWEQANGPIPDGYEIHHRNHKKGDNRLENLELIKDHDHRILHGLERRKQNGAS